MDWQGKNYFQLAFTQTLTIKVRKIHSSARERYRKQWESTVLIFPNIIIHRQISNKAYFNGVMTLRIHWSDGMCVVCFESGKTHWDRNIDIGKWGGLTLKLWCRKSINQNTGSNSRCEAKNEKHNRYLLN